MRIRPALIAVPALALVTVLVGGWLLLRPVDPARGSVPAPITVSERSGGPVAPVLPPPEPSADPVPTDAGPTDVVPPPPIDDDDDDDDDGPDDDDDD